MSSSGIPIEDLQENYYQLTPGSGEFHGIWARKNDVSTGINVWMLSGNDQPPVREIEEMATIITSPLNESPTNSTYELDVICLDSAGNFVTNDNNRADWYAYHGSSYISETPALVLTGVMEAPSRERPTKVPQDGRPFPIELAFPTASVSAMRASIILGMPAEKDLVGAGKSTQMKASYGMVGNLISWAYAPGCWKKSRNHGISAATC